MNDFKKQDIHQPFYPNNFYHIYNRGNNKDKLFYKNENYSYFLNKFNFYLSECLNVYAYCLLPNHFHFLVSIREIENITEIISEQFRKLFLSYSKAINKQEKRNGSLFQKHYKRKLIDNDNYLIQVIYYIHSNSQHHKIINDFKDYPYSSYKSFLSIKPTKLKKEEVIKWFGSKKNFIKYHEEIHQSITDEDFTVEGY
jgi:putative transposase